MTQKITVRGGQIQIVEINGEKYLSLTDMARNFGDPTDQIKNWIRRKDTIEYLGVWEKLHNSDFKVVAFDHFKNEAGRNRFILSPQKWIETTKAIGIKSKAGKYGGTYAHEDISIHFGQWLSPEFSLYVIKEFKRLKKIESQRASKDWQLRRALSKINYRIHTDAVDQHLIPPHIDNKEKWRWFTSEADILNLALFGKTARQWRDNNPNQEGNIRDYATQEQLLVLANLETLNSEFIKEGISKQKRLERLNRIAIEQMKSLLRHSLIKKDGFSKSLRKAH